MDSRVDGNSSATSAPVDSRFRGNDGNYFSSFPLLRESTKESVLLEDPGEEECGCRYWC